MKNIKLFKYAYNNIALHLNRNIQYILVFSLSLVLISFAFMIFFGLNSAYDTCNEVLTAGMKNSGTIRTLDGKLISDEGLGFFDELHRGGIIYSFGSSDLRGNGIFYDLIDIQRGFTQNYGYEISGDLEILTMNPTLIDFCNIAISEGKLINELDFSDDKIIYLYLGDAYKESISLGKIYQSNDFTYIVIGFLEKGSKWINHNLAILFDSANHVFNLDYAAIMFIKYPNTDVIFFNTYMDFDDARNLIIEVADENGFNIAVGSLQAVYESARTDSEIITEYIKQLTGIVLLSSIIIMTCLSTVMIYYNRSQYGIFFSTGFSGNDIFKMLIFEMFVKMLLSLLFSIAISTYISSRWFLGADASFINNIMWGKTFPIIFVLALFITSISWLVPIIIFRKTPITKMIRG